MAQTIITAATPADGITTYQLTLIERAPDSGGTPGAYAQVASLSNDPYNEFISFTDTGGTSTDWYRYRYANTGLTILSDYSTAIQAGDSIIRQWVKADIPDTDIFDTDWDRWRDETLTDLSLKYIGRFVYPPQSVVPSGFTDVDHPINADIRKVTRVEMVDSSGGRVTSTPAWEQYGRYLRLLYPKTSYTYNVYGIGYLRNLADADQEIFMLIYWGIRLKYLDRRLQERENFKYFLTADKVSDVSYQALQSGRNAAQHEFDTRLESVRQSISLPSGVN
jgi:hypothetical protein